MFDRNGSRKYLNEAERRTYLRAIGRETDIQRRAFCLTLFHTGCRISEALNLTAGRLDRFDKSLVFENLKQRKAGVFRSVPIPNSLVRLLAKLVMNSTPGKRVWKFSRPTAYRLITGLMVEAGIQGGMASPKGLRHGFAVACVAGKVPLTTIKKWLGHSRIETTEIYLGVSGREERKLAERVWRQSRKSRKK